MVKQRRRTSLAMKTEEANSDLEKTLSVKTVLKELQLSHHIETFEKEEVSVLETPLESRLTLIFLDQPESDVHPQRGRLEVNWHP